MPGMCFPQFYVSGKRPMWRTHECYKQGRVLHSGKKMQLFSNSDVVSLNWAVPQPGSSMQLTRHSSRDLKEMLHIWNWVLEAGIKGGCKSSHTSATVGYNPLSLSTIPLVQRSAYYSMVLIWHDRFSCHYSQSTPRTWPPNVDICSVCMRSTCYLCIYFSHNFSYSHGQYPAKIAHTKNGTLVCA